MMPARARRTKRRNDSGFAMLLVFVMSAAIAIALFIEVPRVAFESQRAREQMAIDRGLQYQRAIQLFYRKYHLYPQSLDDLETSKNIRFLRHRYVDPLTGKPWRLLHVGPAGQLTDSLIQPAAPLGGNATGPGTTIGTGSGPGGQTSGQSSAQAFGSPAAPGLPQPTDPNDPNAQAPDPLNMAARRPSDRVLAAAGAGNLVAGSAVGGPGADQPPGSIVDPNQPQQGQPTGDPNQPVQPVQAPIPGQQAFPGQQPIPGQPGLAVDPSQAVNPFPGAGQQFPGQQVPGQQIPGQPGAGAPGAQQSQAANLIQNILTTPRQPPASVSAFTTGNTGGIAGVASTAEGKGIHMINNHGKYKEWEFVYDLKKDKTVVGAAGVAQQQQIQQQLQQTQTGTGGGLGSSPFGSTPTNTPASGSTSGTPSSLTGPTTAPPSQ